VSFQITYICLVIQSAKDNNKGNTLDLIKDKVAGDKLRMPPIEDKMHEARLHWL